MSPTTLPVPAFYPHSPARYAADVRRADACLARRAGKPTRTYHVIIRHDPMHRDIAYAIEAPNSLAANLAALDICRDLGDGYRVMRVQQQQESKCDR